MPNRNKGQGERPPQKSGDRRPEQQQRNPGRQQEQQGERSRQPGEIDREKDRYSNDM